MLKSKGFTLDLILAHPGWGKPLYATDVFSNVRLIHFCAWFYGQLGSDVDFDPEFPTNFDTKAKLRSWNALHLQNLENCDAAVTPTRWQRQQHPAAYRDKITIAHEGIDTAKLGPNDNAALKTPNGQVLNASDAVISYNSVLQVSAAHMYLSYPFVLSWLMLEAMASGCLVVGCHTAPVREIISQHENGLIADFFDQTSLVQKTVPTLDNKYRLNSPRINAMSSIRQSYDLSRGEEQYKSLLTKSHLSHASNQA